MMHEEVLIFLTSYDCCNELFQFCIPPPQFRMGKFHGGGQFFQTEFPWRETFLALDFPCEQVCKCLKIVLEIHGNEVKMGLEKKGSSTKGCGY